MWFCPSYPSTHLCISWKHLLQTLTPNSFQFSHFPTRYPPNQSCPLSHTSDSLFVSIQSFARALASEAKLPSSHDINKTFLMFPYTTSKHHTRFTPPLLLPLPPYSFDTYVGTAPYFLTTPYFLMCFPYTSPNRPTLSPTLAATAFLLGRRLSGMVGENLHQQFVFALFELVHHGVVQRVLVLFEPARQVVRHLRVRSGQVR